MSKIVQPFIFLITGAALAYYSYRVIKDAWNNPPPTEYHPEDINAEIYMADNPNYPDFEIMWDDASY